ncbi:MAG: TatD family hydrolase [Candidatus Saccharibacteria bacterium]
MLIDTHCHIHDADYPLDVSETINRAHLADVQQLICVGTDQNNSKLAVELASKNDGLFVAVGVHPHEVKNGWDEIDNLLNSKNSSIIAVGEIGLDYHYNHSPHDIQIQALKVQIELALKYDLPIIFHVREAFDDFWPVFDSYSGIRGVLHSFTDSAENLAAGLKRGLYIGVNGYSTFVRDESQKAMFNSIPLDKILLETDAPYLTPVPFRGKVNEPAFVRNVAEYLSNIRQIPYDEVVKITSENARALFKI